jgi:RNA polymerase sigma-70 factor (ECF subfamily)
MPDEQGLTRRAAQGDAAAFEEIVRMHQRALYGVVLGIVGNPLDADDLTQEAFIRAHRRLASFRAESSLKTWLTRIAINAARDFLRRQRLRGLLPLGRRHEERVAHQAPGAEERLMSRQLEENVAGFMATLSERERTIFSLRFIGGHSLAEISQITSANLSTVKTHLYRALAKARERLGEAPR